MGLQSDVTREGLSDCKAPDAGDLEQRHQRTQQHVSRRMMMSRGADATFHTHTHTHTVPAIARIGHRSELERSQVVARGTWLLSRCGT